MDQLLTVAIPTFKRNEILRANLKPLLPQLARFGAQVQLLILDNASPLPVEDTLRADFAAFPGVKVEIVRNAVNIGANANILRCFERCETPWLWVLGDDDTPAPDALEIILQDIAAHPDALFFNYSSGFFQRKREIFTRGVRGLASKVDSLGNVLFLSSGVHRADAQKPHLKVGYAYLHSQPNFVPLFMALGADGLCCLSTRQIMRWNQPDDEQQWPFLNFALGIMAFLELPMEPWVRRTLARKALRSFPTIETFVIQLLLEAHQSRDSRGALYLFDQICYRLYYFEGARTRLKVAGFRLLIRFPALGYALLMLRKKLKGSAGQSSLQDRFARL